VQTQGHFAADLDPLGLDKRQPPVVLDPALYGFTEADLDREYVTPPPLSSARDWCLVHHRRLGRAEQHHDQ
jgi:2-oxoglutarate dehydrogenase complex dehydrogenase (E1) component-like enzyme